MKLAENKMKEYVEIAITGNLKVKKRIKYIISERINPKIWQWAYLGLKQILTEVKKFAKLIEENGAKNILDLGCGMKPYESLFPLLEKYVGFDVSKDSKADFFGVNWNLPFKDDEFDALISTQVLEHTAKVAETVREIRRVVKSGGYVFISVPLTFPEHEIPYDYYRFTRYGIREVFRDFEIIKISPQNGYINTLFRMLNLLLHYFPYSDYYLFPVFIINNLAGIIADKIIYVFSEICFMFFKIPIIKEVYDNFYMGFTETYVVIVKNIK